MKITAPPLHSGRIARDIVKADATLDSAPDPRCFVCADGEELMNRNLSPSHGKPV